MTLTRDPVSIIVLAESPNAFATEMQQYGVELPDPFIFPVYSLQDAYDASLLLPEETTDWCIVGAFTSEAVKKFLTSVYGPAVDIHVALNVQHDDIAINPALLR